MRGRKPDPTVTKALRGTQRPDRQNPDEPTARLSSGYCPRYLVDPLPVETLELDGLPTEDRAKIRHAAIERAARYASARQLWRVLAPRLVRTRVLSELDEAALAAACLSYADHLLEPQASKGRAVVSQLAELGLTPSARTRISKLESGPKESPLAAVLRGAA